MLAGLGQGVHHIATKTAKINKINKIIKINKINKISYKPSYLRFSFLCWSDLIESQFI